LPGKNYGDYIKVSRSDAQWMLANLPTAIASVKASQSVCTERGMSGITTYQYAGLPQVYWTLSDMDVLVEVLEYYKGYLQRFDQLADNDTLKMEHFAATWYMPMQAIRYALRIPAELQALANSGKLPDVKTSTPTQLPPTVTPTSPVEKETDKDKQSRLAALLKARNTRIKWVNTVGSKNITVNGTVVTLAKLDSMINSLSSPLTPVYASPTDVIPALSVTQLLLMFNSSIDGIVKVLDGLAKAIVTPYPTPTPTPTPPEPPVPVPMPKKTPAPKPAQDDYKKWLIYGGIGAAALVGTAILVSKFSGKNKE
jgi:hypothetical protein